MHLHRPALAGCTCTARACRRNVAVFLALLNAGDTVLGMDLGHGGHLTHGSPVSFSGRLYNAIHYGLDLKTGLIDYDALQRMATEHKPKMIIAGFSAYF